MPRSKVSIGLSEIVCHFDELEDPRSTINRLHPLPSVLTISLMGVLAGAWDSFARRNSTRVVGLESRCVSILFCQLAEFTA